MSGKAYTMKELKSIVEYINQHKHYGQIRGRKMWLDFASAGVTQRTWQSLKETFLKRVLPDIHNPYYKLTKDEIQSFRTGEDVVNKTKNKLTFETANSSTSTNDTKNVNGQPSTSKKENEKKGQTGEDNSNKKGSLRDSVETVIIPSDDCYETTEDLIKTLESNESPSTLKKKTLSLRDRIVYTEPLLPIIQDIVKDFESEADMEQGNPNLNKKENNEENIEKIREEIVKSEPKENEPDSSEKQTNKVDKEIAKNKIVLGKKKSKDSKTKLSRKKEQDKAEKSKEKDTSKTELVKNSTEVKINENAKDPVDTASSTEKEKRKSQNNSSIPLTDTLIPNNQEAVEKRKSEDLPTTQDLLNNAANTKPKGKKRTNSTQITNSEETDFQKRKRRSLSEETTKILLKPAEAEDKEYDENSNKKVKEKKKKGDKVKAKKTDESQEDEDSGASGLLKPLKSCLKNLSEVLLTADSDSSDSEHVLKTKRTNEISESISIEPSYSPVPCEVEEAPNKNENLKTKSETNKHMSPVKKPLKAGNEKPGPSNINKERKNSTSKKEIVVLNSHTESESDDDFQPLKKKTTVNKNTTKNVLKNIFGNSYAVMKNRRRRKFSHHRESLMRQSIQISSDSSEWTSDSGEEHYVPAPRSRNYAHKRYLKPQSSRLLSLGQEGCAFVACGKKIYPIIQDGKTAKNFTTYLSGSDSASEDSSYWKLKYVEEKKKTAELKNLIDNLQQQENVNDIGSPILQSKYAKKATNHEGNVNQENQHAKVIPKEANGVAVDDKVVRIKYVKDNVEVFLEGQWNNIQPILTNVVGLVQNDHKTVISEVNGDLKRDPVNQEVLSSGKSTPLVIEKTDEETQKRVTEMEQKIFKKIEEIDKSELEENNVTERTKRVRPRKTAESVSPAKSSKRIKISTDSEQRSDAEIIINEDKLKLIKDDLPPRTRGKITTRPKSKRVSEAKKSAEKPIEINDSEPQSDNESNVLYKFPSPAPNADKTSKKSKSNLNKKDTNSKKTEAPSAKQVSSFESNTNVTNSNEIIDEDSNDSNSAFHKPFQTFTIQNSTLNTDCYGSESYQLLLPRLRSQNRLKMISETRPCPNEVNCQISINLSPASQDMKGLFEKSSSISMQSSCEPSVSSNISLPVSPELSIVENISVDRISIPEPNFSTINETQAIGVFNIVNGDKFIISQVDVSVPLMTQQCRLRSYENQSLGSEASRSSQSSQIDIVLNKDKPEKTVSDTFLEKIHTVDIQNGNFTNESLDVRLKNLLLESAKKISLQNKLAMEVDDVLNDINQNTVITNSKGADVVKEKPKRGKRCSTPRKRKETKRKTKPNANGIIEECMEFCISGRKSCPPKISDVTDDNACDTMLYDDTNKTKKEVIKVKIIAKKRGRGKATVTKHSVEDSGINDATGLNQSIDLIHNHSETCLQTHECLGDNVQFIENESKSIISLNDSSVIEEINSKASTEDKLSGCTHYTDAQDAFNPLPSGSQNSKDNWSSARNENISPVIPSSLLTDDLSEEKASPTDWFLLSDEDTNSQCEKKSDSTRARCYANLKQIFPLACAVPDLSTITEMSKETDYNSQKQLDENTNTNTRNQFSSKMFEKEK